jgi:hypothetical protein
VCFAKNLASADGSFTGVTAELGSSGACPPGFERPPGVNFCVRKNLTVNARGELLILEAQTSRLCPDGFQRPAGQNICVATNLRLQKRPGSTEIMLTGPDDCPVGFMQPAGSTLCAPGIELKRNLDLPIVARCPKGYYRPPGSTVCIPKYLIYTSSLPANVIPPVGACPANWHRPPGVRFCIPRYIKLPGASNPNPIVSDTIILPCPAGTTESWFEMPVYDQEGLFVVDWVTTRVCVPEGLEPAG